MLPVEGGIVVRRVAPLAAVVAARAAYEIGARDLRAPRYVLEEHLRPELAAGVRWAAIHDHAMVLVAGTEQPLTMDEFGLGFDDAVVAELARQVLERVETGAAASRVPERGVFVVTAAKEPEWVPVRERGFGRSRRALARGRRGTA